jgi:hypothetical protein
VVQIESDGRNIAPALLERPSAGLGHIEWTADWRDIAKHGELDELWGLA